MTSRLLFPQWHLVRDFDFGPSDRLDSTLTAAVRAHLFGYDSALQSAGGPNDGGCVNADIAIPFPAQTLALSRFLYRERSAAFEPRISLVIAANPTTLPFTSFTGDKDMATCIRFPPFRTWMASQS